MLLAIQWNANPVLLDLGFLEIRYYGLLMALGFVFGYYLVMRFFKWENIPLAELDKLLAYVVIGGLGGARLGHFLFYEPHYFIDNPLIILMFWTGGLASHGGAIGILIALYLYSRRKKRKCNYLWIVDRIVVPTAFVGGLIRIGNLMNSEIYGGPTDLPWGFVFQRNAETIPKHPTQIYEAISYFIIFLVLFFIYKKHKEKTPRGYLLGIFLVSVFGMRFLIEFLKNPQVDFEATMLLNMGQILSIPLIIAGAVLWFLAKRRKKIAD
jgi:phosphatidylglycerol---prolipoprotein diacylglyceryl transferase